MTARVVALSVRQPWAELIARGEKTEERRTWSTAHRGRLLIVSSRSREDAEDADDPTAALALPRGMAVCYVDVVACEARLDPIGETFYAWQLANPRRVEPRPLTGRAALFYVDAPPELQP